MVCLVLDATRSRLLELAVAVLIGVTGIVAAQGTGKEPVPIAPIYNPHTKSYFELRTDLPYPSRSPDAVKHARSKPARASGGAWRL